MTLDTAPSFSSSRPRPNSLQRQSWSLPRRRLLPPLRQPSRRRQVPRSHRFPLWGSERYPPESPPPRHPRLQTHLALTIRWPMKLRSPGPCNTTRNTPRDTLKSQRAAKTRRCKQPSAPPHPQQPQHTRGLARTRRSPKRRRKARRFPLNLPRPLRTRRAAPLSTTAICRRPRGAPCSFIRSSKFSNAPSSYPIRGVDLSWWNGAIPFEKLAGTHEIRFAYLKATEGANKKDPAFDDLLRGAHSVGILTGAYHFFNFCDSPQSQFENLSKTAAGELDLPFAIAVEWLDGPSDPKQRDCSRDPEVVKSNLRQLLEDVAARYKKVPIIYAPSSAVGTLIDASFSNYPIWLADYHKILGLRKPTMRGRNPWTIWQFTDHATLPGLDKPVELDVFFGNEEQFSSFVKGEGNIGLSAAERVSRIRYKTRKIVQIF